ncbi:DEAD/DEAH box helicase [Aquirufa novilacunae]|jgi:ATP-dependent RNA helicase RhlE|uniref:DEAD/DEAH box helicase n=1 Tax=Aquirufa novilacunae TaxID=3139305 RepID=A0ABW8TYV4_9BACT
MSFESLHLIEPILKALKEEGYSNPTPIQAQSIPIVLRGTDLLGCAQTGTGKTAAFTLPIIQLLEENKSFSKNKKVRALIVTPTRELAIQIGESFRAYARHTDLKYAVIFGGVGQSPQVSAIRSGADVVIATPGRLLDLMNQRLLSIADVEYFVLDEADRMLDMGFIHDVKKLLAALPHKRQSLFFSATMPPEIVKLAGSILRNPASVSVTPVSSTVEIINQSVYFVDKGNKNDLLLDILQDTSIKTALVFTRTKHGADKVVKMLLKASIKAEAIHGNKSQNARQTALKNFKAQTTRVLVATDIAARGIDIDELEYVVNFELSNIAETYVHRIGRTGRAGAKGAAISFCDIEEKAYLKDIEKLIGKKIPVVEAHKYPMKVLHVEKAAKKPQGQSRHGGGSRPGAPAAAAKDAKPARSFDKASSGRKWYGKKNTY